MDIAAVRRLALALPEATEEPHFEMTSWRVRNRIFATAPPAGDRLHVFVGEHEVRACVAEDPAAYGELRWGQRLSGVRVELATADASRVKELLTEAFLRKAPRALASKLGDTA